MFKSIPILKIVLIGFALSLIFLFPSCDQILQPELAEIIDADNDGYDDRDILFLQKLIDNSQGYGNPPPPAMDPLHVGDQVWTDGRLRTLYHLGGVPYHEEEGFWLYEIPSEIEGAQYLNKIKISYNYLSTIPEEIKNMPRLKEINLAKNRFVGQLPEELWENKSLASLSINNNSFSSFPASMCDALDNINYFIVAHNSFCDVPECISDPGVQSCDCFDYQNISPESICLDSEIICDQYLNEIISNCDLTQIWGQENFDALTSLGSEACLDWSGNCSEFASDTSFADYSLNIDISDTSLDCSNENTYLDYLGWLGDGICDEGGSVNFSCGKFNCDLEDCGYWQVDTLVTDDGIQEIVGECSCLRDCTGECFQTNSPDCTQWGAWGWDCCLDDGTCEDLNGDGIIGDFKGDGWCDDGSWGINFNCQEFDGIEYDCDGGDCGIWNEDLGECVMPVGKTLKRRPRKFKPE
jgi:hypothetical protein